MTCSWRKVRQGKKGVRLEKMQPITNYEEVDAKSLMDGYPCVDEPSGFLNVTTPEFRGVLAQSIDIMATDMYDNFALLGMNDG